jgi:peptidoglycan/xylan/chitin deacetylase (PgdA/CDA1 family)
VNAWTIAGIAGAVVGAMVYAVRGRSSQAFGRSFYRGDPRKPDVALTFDDGPCRSTPALLELLAKHGVRATFFMCGQNVRRFPEIARAVRDAGHEIANHSDSHPYLHFKTPEFIFRELAVAQESIHAITGVTPRWFRPPYGVRWFGLAAAQRRLGLTGVMWSVLGPDWKWPGERVAEAVVRRVRNGSVICLHDGRRLAAAPETGATLRAVEAVIPRLKDRGLRFVTVSEMLEPAPASGTTSGRS